MLLDIETIGLSVKEAQKKNMEIIPDAKFGLLLKCPYAHFISQFNTNLNKISINMVKEISGLDVIEIEFVKFSWRESIKNKSVSDKKKNCQLIFDTQ